MYLKKIVISGFKSFAERISITLQKTHITGIIGPNGSGKSNIIDSVRWVMGEQNTKMLRGEKATDIIFSGSEKRKPHSVAEVSLVFDNSENSPFCPIEYRHEEEISVTRRIYTDGNREYFINQKPCRFRDLTDFFVSSSLGSKSYSMIQQGQVDRILQAKPEEIREIIEEAAGTTIFRNRENETQKRLEATRLNLERVADLSTEVDKQMEALREQVERSKEWQELTSQLKSSELGLWAFRFDELKTQIGELTKKIAEELADDVKNLTTLSQYEAQYSGLMDILEKSDPEIRELNEAFSSTREKLARSEESLNSSLKLIANSDSQIASAEEDFQKENTSAQELTKLCNNLENEYTKTKEAFDSHESVVQESRYQLELINEKETILNNKLLDLRQEIRNIDKIVDTNSGRIELLKKNFQKIAKDKNDYVKRLIHLEENHSQDSILIDSARIKLEKVRRELDEFLGTRNKLELSFEELSKKIAEEDAQLKKLSNEHLYKKAEHATISDLKNHSGEIHEVIRKIQDQFPDKNYKTLTDLVSFKENIHTLPEKTITAFEKWAERFCFSTSEECNEFLNSIKSLKLGKFRACILDISEKNKELEEWSANVGGISFDTFLSSENQNKKLSAFLKALIYIPAEDFHEDILQGLRFGAVLFTSDGTVISSLHSIQHGISGMGLLSQKAKSQKLGDDLAKLEKQLEKQNRHIEELRKKSDNLKQDLKNAQEQTIEKNKRIIEAAAELKSLEAQMQQKEDLILSAREQARTIEEQYSSLETELNDLQNTSSSLAKEKKESELEIKELRTAIEELTEDREELQENLNQKKIGAAGAKERLQSLQSNLSQVQNQLQSQKDKLAKKKKDLEKLKNDVQIARDSRSELESEIGRLVRKREELDLLLREKQQEHAATRETLKDLEQKLQISRDAQTKLKKSLSENEIELEKSKLAAKGIEEQSLEKYQTEISTYQIPENINTNQLTKDIKSLRSKIEVFGPINMMASQEFNDLMQRKEFIDKQKSEVLTSIETLEKARAEIKEHASIKFMSTFVALNKEFQELFPILFAGGEAQLTLVGSEDPLQAGVEIIVRLPGKKPQSMTLFSGGEKALTAISLIFALLKSNPTPFCFLDEVDAPLDETNVRKYNKLLQALSDKFQFIVITHNRRTMEVFDSLFGVTMQEPGVSKIVGVDLAQALPSHLQKSFANDRTVQGASAT